MIPFTQIQFEDYFLDGESRIRSEVLMNLRSLVYSIMNFFVVFLIIFGLNGFFFFSSFVSFEITTIYAQEQNPNIRVEDASLVPQNFRTGETLSNSWVVVGIEKLGALLIVLFIVIYAIKKRVKGIQKNDNN